MAVEGLLHAMPKRKTDSATVGTPPPPPNPPHPPTYKKNPQTFFASTWHRLIPPLLVRPHPKKKLHTYTHIYTHIHTYTHMHTHVYTHNPKQKKDAATVGTRAHPLQKKRAMRTKKKNCAHSHTLAEAQDTDSATVGHYQQKKNWISKRGGTRHYTSIE